MVTYKELYQCAGEWGDYELRRKIEGIVMIELKYSWDDVVVEEIQSKYIKAPRSPLVPPLRG